MGFRIGWLGWFIQVGPNQPYTPLKAESFLQLEAEWPIRGKRDFKYEKDSVHCYWLRGGEGNMIRKEYCLKELEESVWQPSRKRGPQHHNCKEMNSAKSLSDKEACSFPEKKLPERNATVLTLWVWPYQTLKRINWTTSCWPSEPTKLWNNKSVLF